MPTTSNFGWTTPADTDLVKDGALAIRTLGNGIDTSMADLKGGTTGQVLSKTSNTDMDFTWVTTDDANAIQNAIVDAKGDLIAASAADTPARLAVGNNGETLVADSSTSTGLRWQAQSNVAGKNALINGGFDIWQRGTSSASAGGYFTADRWYVSALSGSGTWAQEGTTKPADSNYSFKYTASATAQPVLYQVIETANAIQFAGKNVVLSGKFAASTSVTFSLGLEYSNSTDVGMGGSWTSISATSSSGANPTSTTFVDGQAVFAVPSTARSLRVNILPSATIANTTVIYFAQLQLELGVIPTTFTRAGGTLAGELAACQRYYVRFGGNTAYDNYGIGSANQTTTVPVPVVVPTQLRVGATSVEYANLGVYTGNGGLTALTNLTVLYADKNRPVVYATVASGLTVGTFYYLSSNNSTSGYLGLSAEL